MSDGQTGEGLAQLAQWCRTEAAAAEAAIDFVAVALDQLVWEGPVAEATRRRVAERRCRTERVVIELRALAALAEQVAGHGPTSDRGVGR